MAGPDAPNAIATCIGTRSMNVRHAIWMSAVFNFLGVLVMTHINSSVASTISNMVDFGGRTDQALVALCAALFSIVVYSVAASVFGIPTSESHSLIAGLSGAAIAVQGRYRRHQFQRVGKKSLYGLVLSLVLGFCCGLGDLQRDCSDLWKDGPEEDQFLFPERDRSLEPHL